MINKYIPDTSVIIQGILSNEITKGLLKGIVLIPLSVVAELEHQANTGLETGLTGLEEIKKLRKLSESGAIELKFVGQRPNGEQIKYAKKGEIDALIRRNALENEATLITGDLVQAKSAEAFGIKTKYYNFKEIPIKPLFLKFLGPGIIKAFLKPDERIILTKGKPGKFKNKKGEMISNEQLKLLIANAEEIMRSKGFIKINKKEITVGETEDHTIIITRQPLSKTPTMTVRKKIRKNLSTYGVPKKLLNDIERGCIIYGPPGSGKTTFGRALADYFSRKGKNVIYFDELLCKTKDIILSTKLQNPDLVIIDSPDYKLFYEIIKSGISTILIIDDITITTAIELARNRIKESMMIMFKDGNISSVQKVNAGEKLIMQDYFSGKKIMEIPYD